MASRSFSIAAEVDLSCPVCLQLFKDPNTPKELDCPHVCCTVCIQKILEGDRRFIECPECRHVTQIPEDGVGAMRTNLRLRNLAENYDKCDDQDNPTSNLTCPTHHEQIKHYCQNCKLAVCSTCVVEKHHNVDHNIISMSILYDKQKAEANQILHQMNTDVFEIEESVQALTVLTEDINHSLKAQMDHIDQQKEVAIAQICEEFQTLKLEVQEKEQKRLYKIDAEKSHLQQQAEEIKTVRDTAKQVVDNKDIHEYVVQHDRLIRSMKYVLGTDTKGEVCRNALIGMTKCTAYRPNTINITIDRLVNVAKCQLKQVQELDHFEGAIDVAATSDGVLLVCDTDAKQVCAYSRSKHKKDRYKKRSNLILSSKKDKRNEPRGVAVAADGKYLVARCSHLEMYSPSSNKYEGTLKFGQLDEKVREDVNAYKIKVSPDGTIVVADVQRSVIDIISPDGKVKKTIKTRIPPSHVAIMSRGYITVSNFEKGKVLVIEIESGRESHVFDIPQALGVCYHEQTDCILVGRCLVNSEEGLPVKGTGVIEQYCASSGRLVTCVAEGLCFPHGLAATHDDMLVVADYETVKIYRMS